MADSRVWHLHEFICGSQAKSSRPQKAVLAEHVWYIVHPYKHKCGNADEGQTCCRRPPPIDRQFDTSPPYQPARGQSKRLAVAGEQGG